MRAFALKFFAIFLSFENVLNNEYKKEHLGRFWYAQTREMLKRKKTYLFLPKVLAHWI